MATCVICCVCGREWRSDAKGVLYRSLDRRWWCSDSRACTQYKIEVLRAMQRGLDAAWRALEAAQ